MYRKLPTLQETMSTAQQKALEKHVKFIKDRYFVKSRTSYSRVHKQLQQLNIMETIAEVENK